MTTFEKSMQVLSALFGRDFTFVLATSKDNAPSVRVVDTFYDGSLFWIVTYANSNKVREITANPHVALCNDFHIFKGKAYNAGHPLKEENQEIRGKLIKEFAPWYFAHNNEDDEHMCYVRVEPETGVFHQDGTGYRVDFVHQTAEEFPFAPDIEMIS